MTKIFKNAILLVLAFSILVILTACGNKKDKLIAKKTTVEDDIKIKETIEVSFKNDKVDVMKILCEFEDEEAAFEYYIIWSFYLEKMSNKKASKSQLLFQQKNMEKNMVKC